MNLGRTKIAVVLAFCTQAACLDLNGPSFGGPDEPCWPRPEDTPCERGLECRDGKCRRIEVSTDIACGTSIDCADGEACVDAVCRAYVTACDADEGCRADFYCSVERVCRKRTANSTVCDTSSGCLSGHCADGFCCNTACDGTCQSCAHAKSGAPDGVCANVLAGSDPDDDCFGPIACDASAACAFREDGSACVDGAECLSGNCADGVCCDQACNGDCERCSAQGSCTPILSAEDAGTCDDSHSSGACATTPCSCDSTGACKSGGGVACTVSESCSNGQTCVDAVCCNTPCAGPCEACVSSKTGATTGICSAIPVGNDPDSECTNGASCDGARACYAKANGALCQRDYECSSGACAHSPSQTSRVNLQSQLSTGVCCNVPCDDTCYDCFGNVNANDPLRGTCHAIPRGQDQYNDCGATACGGDPPWAKCTFPSGQTCGANEACYSSLCNSLCIPVSGGMVCKCQ